MCCIMSNDFSKKPRKTQYTIQLKKKHYVLSPVFDKINFVLLEDLYTKTKNYKYFKCSPIVN